MNGTKQRKWAEKWARSIVSSQTSQIYRGSLMLVNLCLAPHGFYSSFWAGSTTISIEPVVIFKFFFLDFFVCCFIVVLMLFYLLVFIYLFICLLTLCFSTVFPLFEKSVKSNDGEENRCGLTYHTFAPSIKSKHTTTNELLSKGKKNAHIRHALPTAMKINSTEKFCWHWNQNPYMGWISGWLALWLIWTSS